MITMKSKLKVFLDISILNLIQVLEIETWRNFVSFQLIKKKKAEQIKKQTAVSI